MIVIQNPALNLPFFNSLNITSLDFIRSPLLKNICGYFILEEKCKQKDMVCLSHILR